MFVIGLLVGLLLGVAVGMVIMVFAAAAGHESRRREREQK